MTGKWVVDPYLANFVTDYLDTLAMNDISYGYIDRVSSIVCVKHIDDLNGYPTVGLTMFTANHGIQVLVNCSYQERYSEGILYHEMTHALFDLDHSKVEGHIHYWQVPEYYEIKDDNMWQEKVDDLMAFIKRGGDE